MTILTKSQIKQLEEAFSEAGNDHIKLMENAGDSIARFVHEKYGIAGKAIAVVCGHGNNGGDGFCAAKKFLDNGAKVRILLADGQPTTDDAIDMFGRADRAGVKTVDCRNEEIANDIERYILEADIVVDAIYGIGFHGELPEHVRKLVELINASKATVICADIPTGVTADTGEVASVCVKADYTMTFTAHKPAHVIYPAADYCGQIICVQIGIDEEAVYSLPHEVSPVDKHMVKLCFQTRRANTHKGSYGTLLSICGSEGMAGAAVFAAKAANQSGVGLVHAVLPRSIYPIVASHAIDPVFTILPDNGSGTLRASDSDAIMEQLSRSAACLVGCGLGVNDDTRAIVRRIVKESEKPLVLDADALNIVAEDVFILKDAKAPIIITPHAGEMGRLSHMEAAEVQSNRLNTAREFAKEFGVYVVLKGANTVISEPDGTAHVNLTGNPGMAKGGSGDVLAGIIGSLLAQGQRPADACVCGVYVHGAAGDCAAARYSQYAMTPMDIIYELTTIFSEIEK